MVGAVVGQPGGVCVLEHHFGADDGRVPGHHLLETRGFEGDVVEGWLDHGRSSSFLVLGYLIGGLGNLAVPGSSVKV